MNLHVDTKCLVRAPAPERVACSLCSGRRTVPFKCSKSPMPFKHTVRHCQVGLG